jgi:perosamine synthetase
MNKNPSKYLNSEIEYLEKVLNSENWSSTGGTWCQILEEQFSEKFESKYAVAMNSGTSTLHAALEAVGVGAGDEVISPALTVVMDTTATIHANAIPVYADIDPKTFNIDPDDIERKITDRTKAIIAVSLYGLPCNMDRIMEIANRHNIAVIEDNAQCFLSRYKGKLAGTLGHVSSWSFENSKHMSCGEGGIITTNNEHYAQLARKVAGHGYKNLGASYGQIKLNQSVYQDPNYKRHDEIGWNYRMPEFNAAIALAQLEHLEHKVEQRKVVANMFIDALSNCDYITPQHTPSDCSHSYFTLGLLFDGEERGISWQEFREKYISFGGDGFYGAWSVPYLEPVMQNRTFVKRYPEIYEDIVYEKGLCPVAERIQPKIMQFKTNYRDIDLASRKAKALKNTIDFFNKTEELPSV